MISGDSQKKNGTSSKRESVSVAGLAEQVRLWILEERRKQMKRIYRKEKKVKKEKAKVYDDRDRKEGSRLGRGLTACFVDSRYELEFDGWVDDG